MNRPLTRGKKIFFTGLAASMMLLIFVLGFLADSMKPPAPTATTTAQTTATAQCQPPARASDYLSQPLNWKKYEVESGDNQMLLYGVPPVEYDFQYQLDAEGVWEFTATKITRTNDGQALSEQVGPSEQQVDEQGLLVAYALTTPDGKRYGPVYVYLCREGGTFFVDDDLHATPINN